jgi:hypothetical protein
MGKDMSEPGETTRRDDTIWAVTASTSGGSTKSYVTLKPAVLPEDAGAIVRARLQSITGVLAYHTLPAAEAGPIVCVTRRWPEGGSLQNDADWHKELSGLLTPRYTAIAETTAIIQYSPQGEPAETQLAFRLLQAGTYRLDRKPLTALRFLGSWKLTSNRKNRLPRKLSIVFEAPTDDRQKIYDCATIVYDRLGFKRVGQITYLRDDIIERSTDALPDR